MVAAGPRWWGSVDLRWQIGGDPTASLMSFDLIKNFTTSTTGSTKAGTRSRSSASHKGSRSWPISLATAGR